VGRGGARAARVRALGGRGGSGRARAAPSTRAVRAWAGDGRGRRGLLSSDWLFTSSQMAIMRSEFDAAEEVGSFSPPRTLTDLCDST
jgi:hypothetical protein